MNESLLINVVVVTQISTKTFNKNYSFIMVIISVKKKKCNGQSLVIFVTRIENSPLKFCHADLSDKFFVRCKFHQTYFVIDFSSDTLILLNRKQVMRCNLCHH